MIEDGNQKSLGLPGAGAGGDQGGLWPTTVGPQAGQTLERSRLMTVGRIALEPLQGLTPVALRRPKGQTQPQERSLEDAIGVVLKKVLKRRARI